MNKHKVQARTYWQSLLKLLGLLLRVLWLLYSGDAL
jgi:hypothetical protein